VTAALPVADLPALAAAFSNAMPAINYLTGIIKLARAAMLHLPWVHGKER